MAFNHLYIYLLIFLSIFYISTCDYPVHDDPDCVYSVFVKTGSVLDGGMNSNVTLTFYDTNGYGIRINNLATWGGLMGHDYNYFETGNLDIFSGRGPCLSASICSMNLTTDGAGSGHNWYCSSVEVTATGFHQQPNRRQFVVEQWLRPNTPAGGVSVIRDFCSSNSTNIAMSHFSVASIV